MRFTYGLRYFWALLIALLPTWSLAAQVITNTPNGTTGGSALNNNDWKALIFTSAPGSWRIDDVTLGLNPTVQSNLPSSPNIEVALYSVVAGVPGTQLATTGPQTVPMSTLTQDYLLSTPSFNLEGNTSYALVLRSDATGIKWGNTSPGTTPTASDGFVYIEFQVTSDAGLNWTNLGVSMVNAVVVNATRTALSAPLLSGWGLLLMGVFLGIIAISLRRESGH